MGGAKREDYRHFFQSTVLSLKSLIEAELSEKLEREITLFFPAIFESDISARSRGLSSMVKDGFDVDYAAGIVRPTAAGQDGPGAGARGGPSPGCSACHLTQVWMRQYALPPVLNLPQLRPNAVNASHRLLSLFV